MLVHLQVPCNSVVATIHILSAVHDDLGSTSARLFPLARHPEMSKIFLWKL